MRRLVGLATVILSVMLIGSGCAPETKTFTVSGERIVVGSGTPTSELGAVEDSTADLSPEAQNTTDSQGTSVVISRTDVDDDGTPVKFEIASGFFTDGKVVLEGKIEERTNVLISVDWNSKEPITLHAVVGPGAHTSFALLDHASPLREDRLLLVGDSRLVEDSDAKFTIRGDVSSIVDKDLSIAVAEIKVRSKNPKEGSILPTSDPVLLQDGRFLFEGIASEPLLVTVSVRRLDYVYWGIANVVVEPSTQIRISPSKSSSSFNPSRASELIANSETEGSKHGMVVESWQSSEGYLEKMDDYANAIEAAAQESTSDSDTGKEQTQTVDDLEQAVEDPYEIFQEMAEIKNSILTSIAQNLDEPLVALLAMELGALYGIAGSRQLENWDKIANELDKDLVARRVLPLRENREKQIKVAKNSQIVVPGQMAPEFTLANLDGEDISLYDVLAENEVVLVDFWASWCGPCIASIPKLKELHSAYKIEGFEIVFVSIDATYDDWKEQSAKQELPWINVGDLQGEFLAQTPVDYGVRGIPTEFLLNPNGEILNRDLTTNELEELLGDRFGSAKKREKVDESAADDDAL